MEHAGLQPEPITLEIWRELPEEFCRQVEVLDGQAVRCESPSRLLQTMTRRLVNTLETAARQHVARTSECVEANMDVDVVLWEVSRAQIRRPDAALYRCAPDDERPLPAHLVLLVVEVLSGAGKIDLIDKRAEYAAAGIPWYWVVTLDDIGVAAVEVLALDHGIGGYRSVAVLEPGSQDRMPGPIRIKLDWEDLRT
ncbi:Uma2 family endonuclease [Nonomuraea typhae]|uniref:Uma2 family endonuclease n=1 Tax=Nonomuraea typhae TaxID=2603600 RepID=A0ABW7Z0X0_9ACTN